jgi:hypothetical protein
MARRWPLPFCRHDTTQSGQSYLIQGISYPGGPQTRNRIFRSFTSLVVSRAGFRDIRLQNPVSLHNPNDCSITCLPIRPTCTSYFLWDESSSSTKRRSRKRSGLDAEYDKRGSRIVGGGKSTGILDEWSNVNLVSVDF